MTVAERAERVARVVERSRDGPLVVVDGSAQQRGGAQPVRVEQLVRGQHPDVGPGQKFVPAYGDRGVRNAWSAAAYAAGSVAVHQPLATSSPGLRSPR